MASLDSETMKEELHLRLVKPKESQTTEEYYIKEPIRHPAHVRDGFPTDTEEAEKEEKKPRVRPIKEILKEKIDNLKVVDVNLCISFNAFMHKTNDYACTQYRGDKPKELVCRRGKKIVVSLEFDREFNEDVDEIKFILETGKKPSLSKDTRAEVKLDLERSDPESPSDWGLFVFSLENKKNIDLALFTPCDCVIGEWCLSVETTSKASKAPIVLRYKHHDYITILFNPWCRDDDVYMEGNDLRDEYVLNDGSPVYQGHYQKSWNHGQFKDTILEICLYLVRKAMKGNVENLHDPVKVSRAISRVVNSQGDDGVLEGNWSGEYDKGKPPGHWNGSEKILRQYFATKQPVKYGQCWVFGGLTTTVCRCLGIPCRTVTNISSAHDTDKSNTIDTIVDENLDKIKWFSSDSVWNFHVWNDAWMKRPDLQDPENKFDGWQAIDATPQEASDGKYQCGPAPLSAIKEGNVTASYDADFVFSEVNGDRVTWIRFPDGFQWPIKVNPYNVGQYLFTYDPNTKSGRDVMKEYKYQEGSKEEREAVMKAVKAGNPKNARKHQMYLDSIGKNPVDIECEINVPEVAYVGDDVDIQVFIRSKEKNVATLQRVFITCMATEYTGKNIGEVKQARYRSDETQSILLDNKKALAYNLKLKADDFFLWKGSFQMYNRISVQCVGTVKKFDETEQKEKDYPITVIEEEKLEFKSKDLILKEKIPATVELPFKKKLEVEVTNPLGRPLTGCMLEFESGGFVDVDLKVPNIKPHGTVTLSVDAEAEKEGKTTYSISLSSMECSEMTVMGTTTVEDKSKPPINPAGPHAGALPAGSRPGADPRTERGTPMDM